MKEDKYTPCDNLLAKLSARHQPDVDILHDPNIDLSTPSVTNPHLWDQHNLLRATDVQRLELLSDSSVVCVWNFPENEF